MTFSAYTASLVATCKLLHEEKIDYDFWELPSDTYVHRGKNIICNHFLSSDCTDLFIIDADMSWNPYDFLKILKSEYLIVGANYPYKNDYVKWAGKPVVINNRLNLIDGVYVEAETLPGGFIKINRKVFEKIQAEKPSFNIYNGVKSPDFWSHLHIDGIEKGDDISFCIRCRSVGYKLYIRCDCDMVHHGFHGWRGNYLNHLIKKEG